MHKILWIAIAALALAGSLPYASEELSFRGDVVIVDLEASSIVVKARKDGVWTERSFDVEVTTELTSRISSGDGQERGEPTPIALADFNEGDAVVVRYEVVKGRNVATSIVRTGAERV